MEEIIQEAFLNSNKTDKNLFIKKINPVGGGCIHKAWCIHLENDKKVFAKTNHIDNFNMFKFESECLLGLKKFANASYIYVPKTLDLLIHQNLSILFLEWTDIRQSQQYLLGKGLALLHRSSTEASQKKFGWENAGYIGSNKQISGWSSNWGEFFVNYRLRPQLLKAKEWGLRIDEHKNTLIFLSSYLNEHKPMISLVHGDLWSGNCGCTPQGVGILYDPASYWADREVDISMTKLFGGFNKEFYEGYEEIWPMDNYSKDRTDIYNLYHILNHANMFGGSYKESSLRILKDLKSRC